MVRVEASHPVSHRAVLLRSIRSLIDGYGTEAHRGKRCDRCGSLLADGALTACWVVCSTLRWWVQRAVGIMVPWGVTVEELLALCVKAVLVVNKNRRNACPR